MYSFISDWQQNKIIVTLRHSQRYHDSCSILWTTTTTTAIL